MARQHSDSLSDAGVVLLACEMAASAVANSGQVNDGYVTFVSCNNHPAASAATSHVPARLYWKPHPQLLWPQGPRLAAKIRRQSSLNLPCCCLHMCGAKGTSSEVGTVRGSLKLRAQHCLCHTWVYHAHHTQCAGLAIA